MKTYLLCGALCLTLAAGCRESRVVAPTAFDEKNKPGQTAPEHDDHSGHDHSAVKLDFSAEPSSLAPGKKGKWTLKIIDSHGQPMENFQVAHEKLLHLVVVSKDLSWFNHIHPEYKGHGVFEVQAALPRPGQFKLFADFTPQGGAQQIASHEVTVPGATALPGASNLVASKPVNKWLTVTALAHDEGVAPMAGAVKYQIALMPMPYPLQAGKPTMLHFQVRDSSGKPLTDIEPYLGAMGHLVVISADAQTYLHAHPMPAGMPAGDHAGHDHAPGDAGHDHPDGDHAGHDHSGHAAAAANPTSDVMFHAVFPGNGLYKAWAQFKHRGKIITAPFVLSIGGANSPAPSATKATRVQQVSIELPDGYKDNDVSVSAGKPVQLNFVLKKDAGCGNEIAVPAAKWTKKLKVGEKASVTVTPTKAGKLNFECSMAMYKGSVKVK